MREPGRYFRDQLLCIVAPPLARDADAFVAAVAEAESDLKGLVGSLGVVHFSSLFLLPPRPGAAPATTQVCLELAVDPRVDRRWLVGRLVEEGFDLLWSLFGDHAERLSDRSPAGRRRWMRVFLQRHLRRAHGGYVGVRDRTLEQIRAEADLVGAGRGVWRASPPIRERDRDVPDYVARVRDDPRAPAFDGPGERSVWRDPRLTRPARALRILREPRAIVPLLLVLAALLVVFMMLGSLAIALVLPFLDGDLATRIGVALSVPGSVARPVIEGSVACGAVALACVTVVLTGRLGRSWNIALLTLACVAIGLLLVAMLASAGWQAWRWYDADAAAIPVLTTLFPVGLRLAAWGFAAMIVAALLPGLFAGIAFLLAVLCVPPYRGTRALAVTAFGTWFVLQAIAIVVLHVVLDAAVARGLAPAILLASPFAPGPIAFVHVVDLVSAAWLVAVLVVVRFGKAWLDWAAGALMARIVEINRPGRVDPRVFRRAQQTHASLVACEAGLVDRCNHMISLTEVRFAHQLVLRLVLPLVGWLGHVWWANGTLGHATGIQFAHWYVIDGGRRLLFMSNYDSDFTGYLDEFIRGASSGVNLVWRNSRLLPRAPAAAGQPGIDVARDFPPTAFGILAGCSHEQWFKAYVRDSMLPHLVRYEAHTLRSEAIARASRFRDAIHGERDPVTNDQLMRVLES